MPTAAFQVLWPHANGVDAAIQGLPEAEYRRLYEADGTGLTNAGAYSHHPHLAYHAGRLYAIWSNHLRDEDCPGQRVFCRQSPDLGATWLPDPARPPAVLFPSLDDWRFKGDPIGDGNRAGTANGFAVVAGELYAINEVLPWIGMQAQGKGRLARRINDDGSFGDIFWLEAKRPPTPAGYPDYPDLADSRYAALGAAIKAYLADKSRRNLPTWDFRGPRNTTTELMGGLPGAPADGHNLCEPSTSFRTPDGLLAMFWRDLGGPGRTRSHRLYTSFSADDGAHWSLPERSPIPDACSRPCAGNLPDARAYLIHNPGGFGGGDGSRQVLTLSLATDGRVFDLVWKIKTETAALRFPGLFKGGPAAAYPHACTAGGFLFVIYSVNKEDVELCRIPLAALATPGRGPRREGA